VSIHVTTPAGEAWKVSRDWFGLPGWSRSEPDWSYTDFTAVPDIGDDDAGLLGLVLFVAVVLFVLLLAGLLLPLLLFLIGLVAAAVALAARLLSISAWTVKATGRDRRLLWRVRGTLTSGRAMREVARALSLGQEPTVGGVAGVAG
jgi:hypothetical protein